MQSILNQTEHLCINTTTLPLCQRLTSFQYALWQTDIRLLLLVSSVLRRGIAFPPCRLLYHCVIILQLRNGY